MNRATIAECNNLVPHRVCFFSVSTTTINFRNKDYKNVLIFTQLCKNDGDTNNSGMFQEIGCTPCQTLR